MPLLGALIAGLFGSLASFFARFLVAKTAVAVAAVTVFAALTVAFVVVISSALTAVLWSGALPSAFVLGFSFFMPDNFSACVSVIISSEIAAALYRWNIRNVQIFSTAG